MIAKPWAMAIVAVLAELMPVLDDIALARANNDLEGPFKSVAESIEAVVTKLGLEQFGEVGGAVRSCTARGADSR